MSKNNNIPPADATAEESKYGIIEAELQRAKRIHPDWPDDLYVQLAVMQEEAGEVAKAILDFSFHKGPADDIKKELIQTAAMCMRMLENFAAQRQPQPTAEGAEEILDKWYAIMAKDREASNEPFDDTPYYLKAMQEFATLHAQRIADKMVRKHYYPKEFVIWYVHSTDKGTGLPIDEAFNYWREIKDERTDN